MTAKIIYEQELQQAIDALRSSAGHDADEATCRPCKAIKALRAVQERDWPTPVARISHAERGALVFGRSAMVRPANTAHLNGDALLYTLPDMKL